MLLAPFCRFFVNLIKKSLTICLWSCVLVFFEDLYGLCAIIEYVMGIHN